MSLRPTDLASTWAYLDVLHSIRYPIWNERHVLRDLRAGRHLPPPPQAERSRTVLLVSGFLDDGRGVEPLAQRLGAAGHHAQIADIGRNVACADVMLGRLVEELLDLSEVAGEPVVLVGHSRGGTLARVAAVRHPELVAGLITLGSPLSRPDGINLPLRLIRVGMRYASRLGVPGLVGECLWGGACCRDFVRDQTGPFPDGIPFTSIRGRWDGMVARDAVEDPAASVVDVDATHAGLPVAPDSVFAIETAIAAIPDRRRLAAVPD